MTKPPNPPLSRSMMGKATTIDSRLSSSRNGPSTTTSRGGMNHSMLPDDNNKGVVAIFRNSCAIYLWEIGNAELVSAPSFWSSEGMSLMRCPLLTLTMIWPSASA